MKSSEMSLSTTTAASTKGTSSFTDSKSSSSLTMTTSWTPKFSFSPTTTSSSTETSEEPTSTKSIAYPTNTAIEKGNDYCYTPADGKHTRYSREAAEDAVSRFCEKKATLIPENTVGIMTSVTTDAERGILVFTKVEWATDQSGCEPKAAFVFDDKPGTGCFRAFDIDYFCNVKEPLSYGGGYVLNTPAKGCIVFKQWASYLPDPEIPANMRFTSPANKSQRISKVFTFPEDGEMPYGPFNHTIAAAVPHLFNFSMAGSI